MNIDPIPADVLDDVLRMCVEGRRPIFLVKNGDEWVTSLEPVENPYATIRVPQAA